METNSGDVTIRFRVIAPNYKNIFVTGDIVELGRGQVDRALKLSPVDGGFEGSLKLKMTKNADLDIKYKYIAHGRYRYELEPLDRTLRILPGQKLIQKIDEYNDFHAGYPEPWLIHIEKLVGRSEEKKKQLGKPPKDAIPVQFVVKATLPHPTCRVVIFGNNKFLGNWEPSQGKFMQYTVLKWVLVGFLAPNCFPLEYKYAIIDANGQVIHETEGQIRKIELKDLAKEQAKGINVSLKINDLFKQEDHSGMSFPFSEKFHRSSTIADAESRSNFKEFLTWDTRSGKLIAGNNFYAQLAMECGKECILNMESFTTHDFPDTDLVHEQLCKSLMDPRTKVRSIILHAKYFANISPKRIAMIEHVLENNSKLTQLILAFDMCCQPENTNDTKFIYDGLSSGKFKFITSAVFNQCELDEPSPIMEVISKNKTLRELSLVNCNDKGTLSEHVMNQLCMNTTLTSVTLRQYVSQKGNEAFQRLLKANKTLTALDINLFTICDWPPFTEIFRCNTTLKKLIVTGPHGPEVSDALKALELNEALQQFSLTYVDVQHQFSEEILAAVHKLFSVNTTLTKMEMKIKSSPIHEPVIHEYLSRNKRLHQDVIVTLFNIARHRDQFLQLLPHDIWLHIVNFLPGRRYDKILNALFDDWSIRKVT